MTRKPGAPETSCRLELRSLSDVSKLVDLGYLGDGTAEDTQKKDAEGLAQIAIVFQL